MAVLPGILRAPYSQSVMACKGPVRRDLDGSAKNSLAIVQHALLVAFLSHLIPTFPKALRTALMAMSQLTGGLRREGRE